MTLDKFVRVEPYPQINGALVKYQVLIAGVPIRALFDVRHQAEEVAARFRDCIRRVRLTSETTEEDIKFLEGLHIKWTEET